MAKLKIGIDIYHLRDAKTGLKTYTRNLLSLESDDFEVILYGDPKEVFQDKYVSNGLKRLFNHFKYFLFKEVKLPLQAIKDKVDFLICPDFVAPWYSGRVKKIAVLHDDFFWTSPQNYSFLWLKAYKFLIKAGIRKNAVVVTTSDHSKTKLKGIIKDGVPIEVVYQSFKTKASKETVADALLELPKKYIFHIGNFDPRKNLHILVKAFLLLKFQGKLRGYKLILAGIHNHEGSTEVYDEIKNILKGTPYNSEVELPGYVSDYKATLYYENAALYAFPSGDEGFGIPILEAFDAKIPVITSKQPALLEIGGDAILSFNTDDVDDLAEKILLVLNNEDLEKQMVKKGEKRLALFTLKNFHNSWKSLIKQLQS